MRWCLCSVPQLVRAAFAEFIGTFVFVVIGNGSIAQSHLMSSKGRKCDYVTVNWGWALGCCLGTLISGKISGGHLNPAVTMALSLVRDFPWKRFPLYWLAQYLGALAATGTVIGIYYEALVQGKLNSEFHHKNTTESAVVLLANFPGHCQHFHESVCTGLVEQTLSTMTFLLVICMTTNAKYSNVPPFLQPIYIGFTLLACGISYGSNNGYALNPARDLSLRLVFYLGGWESAAFSFRDYNWFWIFLVGPHIGAFLGVCIFHIFLKTDDETELNANWTAEYVSSLKRPAVSAPTIAQHSELETDLGSQWHLQHPDINLLDSIVSSKVISLKNRHDLRRTSRVSQISTQWL